MAYKQFIEFDSGLAAANFSTVVPQTITLYFYLVICNTLSHNSHYSVYIRITQSLYPVCEYYLCSTVYMYACIHAYIHVCMYICIYVHLARLGKATSSFASTLWPHSYCVPVRSSNSDYKSSCLRFAEAVWLLIRYNWWISVKFPHILSDIKT